MPPSAEDCRAKAFQCAELAAKTRDPFSKLLLEQTAKQWNVLAVGAVQYELAASGVPQMKAVRDTLAVKAGQLGGPHHHVSEHMSSNWTAMLIADQVL
jgi:hypothetical protein